MSKHHVLMRNAALTSASLTVSGMNYSVKSGSSLTLSILILFINKERRDDLGPFTSGLCRSADILASYGLTWFVRIWNGQYKMIRLEFFLQVGQRCQRKYCLTRKSYNSTSTNSNPLSLGFKKSNRTFNWRIYISLFLMFSPPSLP